MLAWSACPSDDEPYQTMSFWISVQECVLAVWGMKSWLPSLVVRRRREKLTRHMGYIYTSDWLMKLEGGVDSLSHEALSEVPGVLADTSL